MPNKLTKTLGCRMRPEDHKTLRLLSLRRDTAMRDLYRDAFQHYLELCDAAPLDYRTQPAPADGKPVSMSVPRPLAERVQAQAQADDTPLTDAYYTAVRLFLARCAADTPLPSRRTLGLPKKHAS